MTKKIKKKSNSKKYQETIQRSFKIYWKQNFRKHIKNSANFTTQEVDYINNNVMPMLSVYFSEGKRKKEYWDCYKLDVNFGVWEEINQGCHLSLLIDISKLKKAIIDTGINSEMLKVNSVSELSRLTETNYYSIDKDKIYYIKPDKLIEFNPDPIIILECITGMKKVIDGHHRTYYAKEHNISEIESYTINNDFLIENDVFVSEEAKNVLLAEKLFYQKVKY